jgi:hypothetical protein
MELNRNSHESLNGQLPDNSLFPDISQIQHDLKDLTDALALLGVKRCSACNKFFRCSDQGALFDCGKIICFGCVPSWWHEMSAHLNSEERDQIAAQLSSWLRKYHGAEIVKQKTEQGPEPTSSQFGIVVRCRECLGSGKLLEGERCRFCNGFKRVTVVVPG